MPTVDIGWVDIAIVVFLLLSVVVGLMRGFVFELLSLAGWFAAGIFSTMCGISDNARPTLP